MVALKLRSNAYPEARYVSGVDKKGLLKVTARLEGYPTFDGTGVVSKALVFPTAVEATAWVLSYRKIKLPKGKTYSEFDAVSI